MRTIHRILRTAVMGLALAGVSAVAGAACIDCGTVTDVKTVKKQGEGSGAGAVIGGVAGGVLGHQIGGGRGKDVATGGGAVGGAYGGPQVEKESKSTTSYVVDGKMDESAGPTVTLTNP